MGEVYRARDTKLNRDVALKILPDAFASDPDRLTRFTREAQTLAALNHPNIAQIHGLEDSGGVRALVMELIEGEDLRSGSSGAPSHWTKRCRSRSRPPRRSKRRTSRTSSIAT
jgi:serine/threonine protein kinase